MRVLGILTLVACGRVNFDAASSLSGDAVADAPCALGPWSDPELVPVSDESSDFGPTLSPDTLELYFASDRVSPGEFHIFRSRRTTTNDPFGQPDRQTKLEVFGRENDPHVSADGLTLYFIGIPSGLRLAQATRQNLGDDFDNPTLVPGFGNLDMRGPVMSRKGDELFYSDESTKLIHRATVVGGSFQPQGPVAELNVGAEQGYPGLSNDGLTIYFEVIDGSDGNSTDMFTATRTTTNDPFSDPVREGDLSSMAATDDDPEVSVDDRTMVMSSSRAGGDPDIFLSTRSCR